MSNLLEEVMSSMFVPGLAGNGAVRIMKLVLDNTEEAKQIVDNWVPLEEPEWSGDLGYH
jgi:hypothetical protein